MRYPIAVAAEAFAARASRVDARPAARTLARAAAAIWAPIARHWGLLAALALTIGVHIPTLGYYFDGDDFVVLGSVEYLGAPRYIADTFMMRDIVPNWRPLTGAVYAAEWELFGLNATAWRSLNLAIHAGSVFMLYALATRVTRRPMVGAMAAVVFGVSGAHFDTVTYITALPHVLATFFVLSSLLALVCYTLDGERNPWAFGLSFVLFVLAFLANEGAFVYSLVLAGAYAMYGRRWRARSWAFLRLPLHVAPYGLLATGWFVFYQTADLPQLKFEEYYWGAHVFRNYSTYLSWIAFPHERVPLTPEAWQWGVAGGMATAAAFFAVRGPHLARLGAFGMILALLPFAPVEIWTASRYTYASVAFFAPLAAVAAYWLYDRARGVHRWAVWPASAVGLAFVAAVAGLYAWQASAQNRVSGEATARWELLVDELRSNYDDVPDGTTIYIVDGPWTNTMENYTWVPSVARALYGDAAAFNLPRTAYENESLSERAVFLEWVDGTLRPISLDGLLARRR